MVFSFLPRLLIIALTAVCIDVHAFERTLSSELSIPDAKRSKSTISIHTDFTGDEKNLAKDANRTSRLLWLGPELLNLVMRNHANVQRTFYQACRYLSMLVQDINRLGVDGGALIAHIPVYLQDDQYSNKDSDTVLGLKRRACFSTSDTDFSLTASRFALRNIFLDVNTIYIHLTPGAVDVFQKILAANPAIYAIDCRDVNSGMSHNNEDTLHERMTRDIFKNGLWPIDTSRFNQLRYLSVGKYMSLCAKISLLYLFYPHPSQLANLEEIHFAGNSPDIITYEHYGWLATLPKLRKLSVSSDSNAFPGDMIVQMPFEGFSSLTYLRLARVRANQEFYQSLSSLRSLETLKIARGFPDTALSTLPLLPNLTALKILDCREMSMLTRLPNLLHLIVELDSNFGELAPLSSLRTLSILFYDDVDEDRQTENMKNLTSLTQLQTIILKDPCMVIDFKHDVGKGKHIDPQLFNSLPNLTSLIFDIDEKGFAFHELKLPIHRSDLKPSITVMNRKGKVTFADESLN